MRFLLVVFRVQVLTDGDGHVRINACGVNVFLYEIELFPEWLLPIDLYIIQRKRHTRITVRRIEVGGVDAERVLAGNHVLYQFDGRVTFAFIVAFAVLGRHHDILQTVHIRRQLHLHVRPVLTLTQR